MASKDIRLLTAIGFGLSGIITSIIGLKGFVITDNDGWWLSIEFLISLGFIAMGIFFSSKKWLSIIFLLLLGVNSGVYAFVAFQKGLSIPNKPSLLGFYLCIGIMALFAFVFGLGAYKYPYETPDGQLSDGSIK